MRDQYFQGILKQTLGNRGITYTPVIVPSKKEPKLPKPYYKVCRDVVRSWLWLLTGHMGSSLDPSNQIFLEFSLT